MSHLPKITLLQNTRKSEYNKYITKNNIKMHKTRKKKERKKKDIIGYNRTTISNEMISAF